MQNLINIEQKAIGTTRVQTVDARELHAFLEVRRDFTNWIKQRISKYGFIENQDFVCVDGLSLSPNLANQSSIENVLSADQGFDIRSNQGRGGNRRSIAYHVSIDMAKELSMVERTPKGKEARQYFIECERRLRSGESSNTLDNDISVIKQYMTYLRANKASGIPLASAVELTRQTMRSRGIDIDTILPMPPVAFSDTVKTNAEKDAAAREKIFSIIQSQGTVKQGVLYNRCRNMDKNEFQKNLDVLLVQNKIQQFVFEHSATKKRFNLYRMSGALN